MDALKEVKLSGYDVPRRPITYNLRLVKAGGDDRKEAAYVKAVSEQRAHMTSRLISFMLLEGVPSLFSRSETGAPIVSSILLNGPAYASNGITFKDFVQKVGLLGPNTYYLQTKKGNLMAMQGYIMEAWKPILAEVCGVAFQNIKISFQSPNESPPAGDLIVDTPSL